MYTWTAEATEECKQHLRAAYKDDAKLHSETALFSPFLQKRAEGTA